MIFNEFFTQMRVFEMCGQQLQLRGEKFFPFPFILMMNIFHRPVLINMKLARNAETIVFLQHNYNKLAYDPLLLHKFIQGWIVFAGLARGVEAA